MEVADRFRSTLPLKKTEKPRIWSFKTMLETAATMEEMETNLEYVRILRKLLDIHGRLRCAAGVAADFVKVRHFFVSALIYRPDDNRLGTVFRRVCLFVCLFANKITGKRLQQSS